MRRFSSALIALALAPAPANAQQPLRVFLDAAETSALDVREAEAVMEQARAQRIEALGRLLPNASAVGTYIRNELAIAPMLMPGRSIVITPEDQYEGRFTLTVPLLDLGAWAGFFASDVSAGAAEARSDAARQTVLVAVVQTWHQLVAARAVEESARRNVTTLERGRVAAAARVEVGVAPQLELARAEAELARAAQLLADAELQSLLAARALENLTGLAPTSIGATLEDDLSPEPPLDTFVGGVEALPAVRAAREDARAASIGADTAWFALLPVISGALAERLTNATGFQGRESFWTLTLTATWMLDVTRPAQIATREAQADAARVRAERTVQQQETAIFEAWHRVEAARARAQAAGAALDASRRAAEDALARFETGAATQLDVIQAQRDLFQAEVARIQAIAELRIARLVLRIRSGQERP